MMDGHKLLCTWFFLCVNILLSRGHSIETEELLTESVKRLSELFDDVSEIKEDVAFIAESISNGEYTGPSDNEESMPKLTGARVTIAQVDATDVMIRVNHPWGNVESVKWFAHMFSVLPEDRYPQGTKSGSFFISLSVKNIQNSDVFPGPLVSVFVQLGGVYYGFVFDVLAAVNSENKTFESSPDLLQVKANLTLHPIGVSPASNIAFKPGDTFDIEFSTDNQDADGDLYFYTISADSDESVAISYTVGRNNLETPFSFPNRSQPILRVDSSKLETGGVLSANLRYRSHNEIVREESTSKPIVMHRVYDDAPIPKGRVAIMGDFYANQTIGVGAKKGCVTCEALGSPIPEIEIRIDGHAVDGLTGYWPTPYSNLRTVYDIPVDELVHGLVTCYASNGLDDAEMVIDVRYKLTVVEELNKIEELEDGNVEVTCAFRGNPAPHISFYRDYMAPSNKFLPDDEFIKISEFQNGYITQATLVYDKSVVKNVWSVTCSGESDGQTTHSYLYRGM